MGHQFGHVEKVVHMTDGQVEILHMTDCHVEKILHMRNVKKIYGKCGEIMCTMYGVLSHFMLFCSRICFFCDLRCFVAKYIPRNSRAFAWRKI